ncbi:MAG: metallophosphoesterase [Rikenellaceae bacterium]
MKILLPLLATIALLSSCCNQKQDQKIVDNISIRETSTNGLKVDYYMNGLEKETNIIFISDCHITVEDQRGAEFYQYSKRMGGWAVEAENYGTSNGREQQLLQSIEKAKENNADLVILAGDIINFPSEASVELIKKIMDESGLTWVYIAGNHDWHYEGMEGTATDLRASWVEQRLTPLYQGENSMYSSRIINGINFVVIDNSTNEVSQEQLDFFKKQTQKSEPIILSMHIPLYTNEQQDPGNFGCGHPKWNAQNDDYYQIERRKPWRESGHTATTLEFREVAFNTPTLLGILAGHTHLREVDFYNGVPQMVNGANFDGSDITVHFHPAK